MCKYFLLMTFLSVLFEDFFSFDKTVSITIIGGTCGHCQINKIMCNTMGLFKKQKWSVRKVICLQVTMSVFVFARAL